MRALHHPLKLAVVYLVLCSILLFFILFEPQFMRANAGSQSNGAADQSEFFEKQVRPILFKNCSTCHNSKAKTAQLDLTTSKGFDLGGEGGPLIDREKPENSRLLKVILYQDQLKMPPTGKLKDEEITILTSWIKMGAPWPEAPGTSIAENKRSNRSTEREFTEAEKKFWSYQALAHPAQPRVKRSAWIKSPIDAFILQKLELKSISPAPPVDKFTLLRRATYDLTGLPPTQAEIRDFVSDSSPDAFEKVVDRLLSSPRYGEKWGRFWLDVARYADSTGNDEDHRYPFAWKYRDYVIEAFNADLPYDQFVREQIAGDLLPSSNSEEVNRRGIIATGFLALGPKALAQQDKKKMLYDVYDEQVEVTSRAFLGLTVSCARCHNHKFDPILTRDYYSMAGIFASTKSFSDPRAFVSEPLNKPLVPKSEYDLYLEKKKGNQAQVKLAQTEMSELLDTARYQLVSENKARLADYMVAARKINADDSDLKTVAGKEDLSEAILKKWVEYLKKGKVREHLLEWENAKTEILAEVARGYQERFINRLAKWTETLNDWRTKYQQALAEKKPLPDRPEFEAGQDRFFHEIFISKDGPFSVSTEELIKASPDAGQKITRIRKELDELKKQAPPEPELACAVEEGETINQKVFIRGDYHNEGEDAPKGFPKILAAQTEAVPIASGSGRLQLAAWITQPGHPLTARVMANRIWQWHFGEGIVRTPDNFGKMGEPPTHAELLDYLARRFVESGWSIKSMHRLIMLSSAYQMSSGASEKSFAADPENRLFSRFSRRRLSVEEMRDGLLAIDQSLDLRMGGTLQTGTGTDGENDNKRLSLNPEMFRRRTIYLPLRRANLPALLNLFDFGDATTSAGKRQMTNVATQALFWLNSEFLNERAKRFSQTILDQKGLTDSIRIRLAYLRILNRPATEEEVMKSGEYITLFQEKYSKSVNEAWQSFTRVLMASNEFIYLD
ncbi:MAG: PSD1 and planctomycete cytochrome C domain-containing protein [Acidobacteria bacterium]|nr:PSD1 and planctomycete cytochrome C domain-containing protein [Acidobacteriota bacterium]